MVSNMHSIPMETVRTVGKLYQRAWFTVNGKGIVCVGDPVSCGSTVASGDGFGSGKLGDIMLEKDYQLSAYKNWPPPVG